VPRRLYHTIDLRQESMVLNFLYKRLYHCYDLLDAPVRLGLLIQRNTFHSSDFLICRWMPFFILFRRPDLTLGVGIPISAAKSEHREAMGPKD